MWSVVGCVFGCPIGTTGHEFFRPLGAHGRSRRNLLPHRTEGSPFRGGNGATGQESVADGVWGGSAGGQPAGPPPIPLRAREGQRNDISSPVPRRHGLGAL